MLNTEQTLPVAMDQLRCINPDTPATASDLFALRVARDSLDALIAACVEQLRTDPNTTHTWSDIANALALDSATAARLRFGASPLHDRPSAANFWRAHAGRFAWDFLPVDFLHALYVGWLLTESPTEVPLEPKAFTRQLKSAVPGSGWVYSRSRSDHLMRADEPLIASAKGWSRTDTHAGLYGFRRTSATRDRPQ